MLTDSNNQNNTIITKKSKTSSKNYIINSERSNKRNGISLPKGVNRNKKYNLTKVIQDVQTDKKGVKNNNNLKNKKINNLKKIKKNEFQNHNRRFNE